MTVSRRLSQGTSGDRNVLKTVLGRPLHDIDWWVAVLPHSVPAWRSFSSTSDFCPPLYLFFDLSLCSFSFSHPVSSQSLRSTASIYPFFVGLTLFFFFSLIFSSKKKKKNGCLILIKTQELGLNEGMQRARVGNIRFKNQTERQIMQFHEQQTQSGRCSVRPVCV